MIQFTINDMKDDVIKLFQDERVWQAITELGDDSVSGNQFIKTSFLVEEISILTEKINSKNFKELTEKYEKTNLKESLLKFKKTTQYVNEKVSLNEEEKYKLYQKDIKIAQENALKWFKKRWKSEIELTIEYINTNSDSKKVFEEQCFHLWEQKINSLILESQKSNFYEFEEKVYTNRHFYLMS